MESFTIFSFPNSLLVLKAISIFCFLMAFLILFKVVVLKRLIKIAHKTKNKIDDIFVNIIESIGWLFYIGTSIFISLQLFTFSDIVTNGINVTYLIIVSYQVVRSGHLAIHDIGNHFIKKHKKRHPKDDVSAIQFLIKFGQLSLWALGVLLVLSNLGYNITSLIAGLGIGGIAIALALQNILTDIFSSFSIYLDKPFKIGDYIEVKKHKGVVKTIGIKTTRLETPQGEELIVPNRDLIDSYIQNYKRMDHRRVIFYLHIDQDATPIKKIEKIPEIVHTIIDVTPHNDIERVHLKKIFGNLLVYEVSYIMKSDDYMLYLDTRQQINMQILTIFKRNKIKLFNHPGVHDIK